MELPTWAFKTESVVRRDGAIDLVFRLRRLGRLWLYWSAFADLIRTTTITITIGFDKARPVVSHVDERVEPSPDYTLEDEEVEELVKRIPPAKLPFLVQLAELRRRENVSRP